MKSRTFLTIILAVMLTMTGTWAAEAEARKSDNPGSAYLAEYALKMYNRGNYEDAIHEFSKALMLDPQNPVALKYLKKMGIEGSVYQGAETKATQMGDLSRKVMAHRDEISEYEAKMADLKMEKTLIEHQFNQLEDTNGHLLKASLINELERDVISKKARQAENEALAKESLHDRRLQGLKGYYERKNEILKDELEYKDIQIRQMAKPMADKIERFESAYEKHFDNIQKSLQTEDELAVLSAQYNKLRTEAVDQKIKYDQMYQVLEEYLYIRTHEVGELSDQLLLREMDLALNEDKLVDRYDELIDAHDTIERYIKKLDERQAEIDDKNQQMIYLKEKLDSAKEKIKGM